jgi:hypothetical protein
MAEHGRRLYGGMGIGCARGGGGMRMGMGCAWGGENRNGRTRNGQNREWPTTIAALISSRDILYDHIKGFIAKQNKNVYTRVSRNTYSFQVQIISPKRHGLQII